MKKEIERNKISEFQPMRASMNIEDAIKEANRCLLCHDAPCSKGCPAGTDPGKFIRQIKFYNFKGAARTIRNNNVLGATCSFICPVEKLCEKNCSATGIEETINIPGLQRFACEFAETNGLESIECSSRNNSKVAVIGAGPSGMSCAYELSRAGFNVVLFDKENEIGGIPRWNIPDFRLPRDGFNYDKKNLIQTGVEIQISKKFEKLSEVSDLLKTGYSAVYLATGLTEPFRLPIFEGIENVYSYFDYLKTVKVNKDSLKIKDKIVAVIGGGSVAMDSAVTSVALGAKKVYLISLENLGELPADQEEIKLGQCVNIIFKSGNQVTEITKEGNKITELLGKEVEWAVPGNFSPSNARLIHGTGFKIKVDFIIEAIGTRPGKELSVIAPNLKIKGKGIIETDSENRTNLNGIFAGGDVINGGSTVVQAVADGKKAALSIITYLTKGAR